MPLPALVPRAVAAVMLEDFYPVRWDGPQAVVTLPEHIGASNAGQVRNALLSVINFGATTLIADMTATVSCDHYGADAVVRAWRRTVSSGTELRLVVTAGSVSQVLGQRGLDRQVSVYPTLNAAVAARLPAQAAARRWDEVSPNGSGALPFPPGEPPGALAGGDGAIAAASDISGTGPADDLADATRHAAAAYREHLRLLDEVVSGLFAAGLSLRAAAGLPADAAGQRTDAVLDQLDDIIRQIRGAAFNTPGPAPPRAPGDDQ